MNKFFAVAASAALLLGGVAASSQAAAPKVVPAPATSVYTPVAPYRVLDTRVGTGAPKTPVAAFHSVTLHVPGIPVNSTGVALNVTVTQVQKAGWVSVGPALTTLSSNLNFVAGQTVPNFVLSKVSPSGDVVLYNGSAGTLQLIADVQGYTSPTPQPAGPATVTVTTSFQNRDDGGNHGVWAGDSYTRSMTAVNLGPVPASNCGATSTTAITECFLYRVTATDTGGFITKAGALSPNAGTAIAGIVSGTLTGAMTWEIYSDQAAPSAARVPAGPVGNGGTSTSNWPTLLFDVDAHTSVPTFTKWSWTATAPATCEFWIDANTNGDGTAAGAGDITGVNHCV